jgi:hypothetical protein
MQPALQRSWCAPLERSHFATGGARKTVVSADIPLDFAAKASIAEGVDGLPPGRRPAWPRRRSGIGAR